ncbi:MAG: putative peroxiredoxin bcp [Chloroflexi bacterium ADurb.Bin180]|jgi:peroxiredoxin|nr:MAG: putative peroxiredoxin bcp [Chloroflexi bacterium ADurb.Bin180]
MLKAGDRAPDFALVSDKGDKVKLSGLKGKKVILYFFPKAGTSG